MERPNYRVLLSYDSERKVFIARVPELPPCVGEGANRGEALANMERELDALLSNMQDGGGRVPPAIDEMPSSGEITIKVSRTLHRDLAFAAQVEDIELSQLASELLTSALEHRQRFGRPQRRSSAGPGPREGQGQGPSGDEPPRRHDRGERGNERGNDRGHEGHEGRWRGGDRNTAARFHGLLEDRASFMEYVRGLEADGGHGRGPRSNYGPPGHGGQDRGGGGGRRPPGQGQGQGQGGPRGDRPRDRGGDRRPGGGGGGGGGQGGDQGSSSGSSGSGS